MIRILNLGLLLIICTACNIGRKPVQAPSEADRFDEQQIRMWIEQEKYGTAWDALVSVEADNPDYSRYLKMRNDLQQKVENFEDSAIRNAQKSVETDKWAEALDIYDEALVKIPKSTKLKDRLAALHAMQSARTEILQTRLRLIRGEELAKSIAVYQEIAVINPRETVVKQKISDLRSEGTELAGHLSRQARTDLKNGDLPRALTLIESAAKLSESPSIRSLDQEIRAASKKSERKSRKSPRSKNQNRKKQGVARETALTAELERFDQLLRNKDYMAAAEVLSGLDGQPDRENQIANRRNRLKTAINQRVDHFYQQGVKYYSQENYSLAIQSWSEVLKLQPEHEKAQEYSGRATRIVEKLKKLREKQRASESD